MNYDIESKFCDCGNCNPRSLSVFILVQTHHPVPLSRTLLAQPAADVKSSFRRAERHAFFVIYFL